LRTRATRSAAASSRRRATLGDFRARYATYRTDPHLQEAHRLLPWSVTIDDNEIDNDLWNNPDPAAIERRTAGYQAFWENMPLSPAQRPVGNTMPGSFRRLRYGNLATFHMIDSRQFRTQPPTAACAPADRPDGYCPDVLDPNSSILGDAQEAWLLDGLSTADTTWNVLGNQFAFTQRDGDGRLEPSEERDLGGGWDRYVADRQTILDHLQAEDIRNLVIVTGDSHRNWVLDTPPDHRTWDAAVAPVCTEFMVTSVTSGGEREPNPQYRPLRATPHCLYRDNSHGYGLVTVAPDEWRTDYRAVSTIWAPTSTVETLSSWTVRPDQPGAIPA
jgi:alkaline phosphatase D